MTTAGHDVSASPQAVAAIEDALRAFAKALRAIQLYLPNNPTRAAAIEQARAAFRTVWQVANPFEIHVRESSFLWAERTVYLDAERGTDGLPWLLYRDGLRSLRLHSGFESTDLEALLAILHKARTASPDDDDLVTLLWVADLATIEYRHVEHGIVGDIPAERGMDRLGVAGGVARAVAGGGAGGAQNVARLAAPAPETSTSDEHAPADEHAPPGARPTTGARATLGEGPLPGMVRVDDFDSTLYFLDARETTYLQEELTREYAEDHRKLALASLFDVIEGQSLVDAQLEALHVVDELLIEFLTLGDYELVAIALREASTLLRRLVADERVVTALRGLSARLSEPAVMSQLLQALDESTHVPVASLLEELFLALRPSALEPLVAWLGVAMASPVRASIERASTRLAGTHTTELARLLEHENEFVVRGALRLAAQLATPAAVPGLARLLRGHDARLRVEALNALGEIASPAALQAVERGIDDSDRDVRVAAFRVIATRAHAAALPRLLDAVRRKESRAADLSEKMALFEAFGSMCGDAGVSELDTLLNARGLLGAREPAELRACAALALGMVASPAAIAALQRAADTKDVVVRSAVARAMRGNA